MRGNKTPISNTIALYLLMTTQQAEITKFKIQANKKEEKADSHHAFSSFEPLVGFEPTTPRLQITCSGQLS